MSFVLKNTFLLFEVAALSGDDVGRGPFPLGPGPPVAPPALPRCVAARRACVLCEPLWPLCVVPARRRRPRCFLGSWLFNARPLPPAHARTTPTPPALPHARHTRAHTEKTHTNTQRHTHRHARAPPTVAARPRVPGAPSFAAGAPAVVLLLRPLRRGSRGPGRYTFFEKPTDLSVC